MAAPDYFAQLVLLQPPGKALPREEDTDWGRLLRGLSLEFERVDARARKLIIESDPRTTLELLPDWERAYGLPDECLPAGDTVPERREALVTKLRDTGRQDLAYWYEVADILGWRVTIVEHRPFIVGINTCGDPLGGYPGRESGISPERWEQENAGLIGRLGPPEIRFWWHVIVHGSKIRWFRCGESALPERIMDWDIATVLECLMRRDIEAHTLLTFEYRPEYIVTLFRCGEHECGERLLRWEYDNTYY
ncbi:MAG: DUF2313 domain-containing protein [Desulfovibrio sp.]|jgi:uncharacterized protein YmfQ (DUF2313 family)|nr:DUF2313 domain-containing protein [Desulfovibrio sp.]